MDYSWVLVALIGIVFLPELFDNDSDGDDGQGDAGDGGTGDDGGSMDGIDDLIGDPIDSDDGGVGDDTDDSDDGSDTGSDDDVADGTDDDTDTEDGNDDVADTSDSDGDDVPDTSDSEGENDGSADEDDDAQLVCIDADGDTTVAEVADFNLGEDVLSISMNPDAVDGELNIDVQNSADGEDSMVYVEEELMAILRGTPNATAEDVMVSLIKMAA